MPTIQQDPRSHYYRIRFQFAGRRVNRSLKTKELKTARSILGRVEETLRLIEHGRLEIPSKCDPIKFILSDGKISQTQTIQAVSLRQLLETYQKRLPERAKEPTTIKLEQSHIKNLLRHLPGSKTANALTTADIQRYVELRLKDKRGNRSIRPDTVKREIDTFRAIWNWGKKEYVEGDAPTQNLLFSKRDQKPPFMTWEEIELRLSRGGYSQEEEQELWSCLYLTSDEIANILQHVKDQSRYPFIFPMFSFVAFTGVRRSEMMRAQIDDFDFQSRTILVREKKRSRNNSTSYRRVDMATPLVDTLTEWFETHPGGRFAFCMPDKQISLTRDQARDQFQRTLKKSKWEKVRGFHVFRHSFASNLASKGVDQRVIDLWMGHQTEEMRQRYRHLLPSTRKEAIDLLIA